MLSFWPTKIMVWGGDPSIKAIKRARLPIISTLTCARKNLKPWHLGKHHSLLPLTWINPHMQKSHLMIYKVETYSKGGLDAPKTQTQLKPYTGYYMWNHTGPEPYQLHTTKHVLIRAAWGGSPFKPDSLPSLIIIVVAVVVVPIIIWAVRTHRFDTHIQSYD